MLQYAGQAPHTARAPSPRYSTADIADADVEVVLPVLIVARIVMPLAKVTEGDAETPLIVNVTAAPLVPQPATWVAELTRRLKFVVALLQVVVVPQSVPPTYARTTEPAGATDVFSFASPVTVIGESDPPAR